MSRVKFVRCGCDVLNTLHSAELVRILFHGRTRHGGGLLRAFASACEGFDTSYEKGEKLSARTDVEKLYGIATEYVLNIYDARVCKDAREYVEDADVGASLERLFVCLSIVKQISLRLSEPRESNALVEEDNTSIEKHAFFEIDFYEALLPALINTIDIFIAAVLHHTHFDRFSDDWQVYLQTQDELHSMSVKIKDFTELHSEVIQQM
ncbi:hypothetical protein CYMTET_41401 [Cymbomonas tetramitiformis]|uniref:Uncharacterized protein n=1 Tax=Cymbomonas tetramitiformis TaxID=36881 RepID=A0AAE0C7H6_9CHLO|nr:hypothetical protein CYMTET_41401 [Cymbomonas tetramitiformis]